MTILRDGEPVARLVPIVRATRTFGQDEGIFTVPEDFDAPLPDEVLASFYR